MFVYELEEIQCHYSLNDVILQNFTAKCFEMTKRNRRIHFTWIVETTSLDRHQSTKI